MYTNADITLYLYSKEGKMESYSRLAVERVYWEDVRHSTFLKTGQRDGASVLLVIPASSVAQPLGFTQGRDLVVNGIVDMEVDSSTPDALVKSLSTLKSQHGALTVTTIDKRMYGSRSVQHYELTCK